MRRQIIQCLAIAILITGTGNFVTAVDHPLPGMERFDNLKQIGKVIPRRSEDIKASPWGLQFNKHDLPVELMDLFLERIAETGVKWARVETRSYIIEHRYVKEKGHYRWSEFDRIIDGLSKRKIEIFITINSNPYTGMDAEDKPLDKKKLSEWLEYVAAVVKHCHDRVRYWEIDNEPKITVNYAEMVKSASSVIKKIDPQAKVNLRIKDVSIKDPVVADLLGGRIYKPKTSISGRELMIKGVVLTDYPIAVLSGKSCIGRRGR